MPQKCAAAESNCCFWDQAFTIREINTLYDIQVAAPATLKSLETAITKFHVCETGFAYNPATGFGAQVLKNGDHITIIYRGTDATTTGI